jgi:hypothetical protein
MLAAPSRSMLLVFGEKQRHNIQSLPRMVSF